MGNNTNHPHIWEVVDADPSKDRIYAQCTSREKAEEAIQILGKYYKPESEYALRRSCLTLDQVTVDGEKIDL
jgi:hypothetical protein